MRKRPIPSGYPAYAWPGGYTIAYVAADGEFLCAECCRVEHMVHTQEDDDQDAAGVCPDPQWHVVGYQTDDWHTPGDPDWICAHCEVVISSKEVPE